MSLKVKEDKFKLIGGMASLDFANTVGGRLHGGKSRARDYQLVIREERLADYLDLLAWSQKSGLSSSSEVKLLLEKSAKDPRAAETVLKRAIKLREVLYRLFKCAIEGWEPEATDLAAFNEELLVANRHQTLAHDRNGFHLKWIDGDVSLDKMLWVLARSAEKILTSAKISRVKQCGGNNCGWIFLDTSRSGNRTWCDMKDCGNLAKVHRFRRKQAAS
jgi:predicted RNA-binding Zn ribbon-like protein